MQDRNLAPYSFKIKPFTCLFLPKIKWHNLELKIFLGLPRWKSVIYQVIFGV